MAALVLGVVVRHEHGPTVSLLGAGICRCGAAIIRDLHILRPNIGLRTLAAR